MKLLGSARRTARETENASLFYMLDERGCAGLVDAGHRGRELVDLLVLRRGGAEIVRAELSDIRVVIICLLRTEQRGSIGGDVREPLYRSPRWRLAGHPIGDAGADADRGKAAAGGREEGRDVSALGPAHAADPVLVDPALRHKKLHAALDVPRVANAEVAVVERAEGLAITRGASVLQAAILSGRRLE